MTYKVFSNTPGAGGANISVSQVSGSIVDGSACADTPPEGLAVVEQPAQDDLLVPAGSNEIPPPIYDPRSVSLNADQRQLAQLERDYAALRESAQAIIAQQQERIEFLRGEIETAELRIASLEANRSLPLDEPTVKESLTVAADILNAAAGHLAARASTYDSAGGERSICKAVTMFNACTGHRLTEAEGWLLLQCLKDVRLFQRPGYHADSAEDCTAYSALKAEAKAREAA